MISKHLSRSTTIALVAALSAGCSAGNPSNSSEESTGGAGTGVMGSSGSGGGGVITTTTGAGGTQPGMSGGAGSNVGTGGSGGSGVGQGGSGGAASSDAGVATRGDAGGKSAACKSPVNATLTQAPVLEPGVWKDITPPGIPKGDPVSMIAQGIAVDPCNLSTVYWGNTPFDAKYGGLFKSTDAGLTWKRIGKVKPNFTGVSQLDEPLHVRVDPTDPQHLYVGDGVRGGTTGFWVSHDGGENFDQPQTFVDVKKSLDVYDVAVDPTDFNHVLVSYHSWWYFQDPVKGSASGVLESKDGGATWIVHEPIPSWGTGHAINFLYSPELGQGDSQTWLLGTQGNGQWRTADGGKNWTKVTDNGIFHGGGDVYYAKTGVLYVTGVQQLMRSEDNGVTLTKVGPNYGNTGVLGDGTLLYTAPAYSSGMQPFFTSPETDGKTWTAGTQKFNDSGPFEIALDPINRILYSSMWFQGVWAMKIKP